MEIQRALPTAKYAKAARHSTTPEFRAKVDGAVKLLRAWVRDDRINHVKPPEIRFGYGKDALAVALLCNLAQIPFVTSTVLNGGDIPTHELCIPEIDRFLGERYRVQKIIYRTEFRYIEYLADAIDWGLENGMKTKTGQPINYWDMGDASDILHWDAADKFVFRYQGDDDNILVLCGHRGAEAMDRFYRFRNNGILYQPDGIPLWEGYPLHDWSDLDVWALLVQHNAPISPVYSYHQIPQKLGKQVFPRTYWYPEPALMNYTFYKWLARYAPVQLKELCDWFPEIDERLKPNASQGQKAVL